MASELTFEWSNNSFDDLFELENHEMLEIFNTQLFRKYETKIGISSSKKSSPSSLLELILDFSST